MELAVMARTKPQPAEQGGERRAIAVTIKGNEDWKTWLEAEADDYGISVSAYVDLALRAFAKANGSKRPIPKR